MTKLEQKKANLAKHEAEKAERRAARLAEKKKLIEKGELPAKPRRSSTQMREASIKSRAGSRAGHKAKAAKAMRTPAKWEQKFLEAYVLGGVARKAAAGVGISFQTVITRKKQSPEFAAKYEEAKQMAIAGLEQRAWDRAYGGSDTLVIFLLKAMKPQMYRDSVAIHPDLSKLTDAEIEAIIAGDGASGEGAKD